VAVSRPSNILSKASWTSTVSAERRGPRPVGAVWAKRFLKQITPFREWVRQSPRTEAQRNMYLRIVREAALIIAGKRPNKKKFRVVTVRVVYEERPLCRAVRTPRGTAS
jgi:hypothetical protein